eukprot:130057-Rhodomonas_salina.1
MVLSFTPVGGKDKGAVGIHTQYPPTTSSNYLGTLYVPGTGPHFVSSNLKPEQRTGTFNLRGHHGRECRLLACYVPGGKL